jgi:hypothetical protein
MSMNYTTYGMPTFPAEPVEMVRIENVIVEADTLIICLNDGREIHLNMRLYPWLHWLLSATQDQRSHWEIVPSGGGVWWSTLDEGVELQPLLDTQPLLPTGQSFAPEEKPA